MKKIFSHFEEYFLIGSLWVLLFLLFFQVVLRYFFGVTWNWIEEVARFLFLWMVWIGAGFAAKCRAHLKIEAFTNMMPKWLQSKADFVSLLIWIVFAALLAWKGFQLTALLFKRNQLSPVLQIPMAWAYAAVPAGVGLMLFRLLQQLYERLFAGDGKTEEAK